MHRHAKPVGGFFLAHLFNAFDDVAQVVATAHRCERAKKQPKRECHFLVQRPRAPLLGEIVSLRLVYRLPRKDFVRERKREGDARSCIIERDVRSGRGLVKSLERLRIELEGRLPFGSSGT